MPTRDSIYVDGTWVASTGSDTIEVVNPATEEVVATIAAGTTEDVDRAVAAARRAFAAWSATSADERAKYLYRLQEALTGRATEVSATITTDMGAPKKIAQAVQTGLPITTLGVYANLLSTYAFEEMVGNSLVVREPIGVVGAITPWNYPLHQVVAKVAPALAAGCTIVLKPSEVAPLAVLLFADLVHEVGLPPGVFNVVTGYGPVVGEAIAAHPDVDMVSFTGSTAAGKRVTEVAAATVKKVALELGGKSANVILPDADLAKAVKVGVGNCFLNSGQTSPARPVRRGPACWCPRTGRPRPSSWQPRRPPASRSATRPPTVPSSARWFPPASETGSAATSSAGSPRAPPWSPAVPRVRTGWSEGTSSGPLCSPTSAAT